METEKERQPMNNEKIVTHCLNKEKVNEILGFDLTSYRIKWSNGVWSPVFIYGVNDIYQKEDEPKRRYVACFNDHVHEIIKETPKRIITLTRDDLVESKSNLPIEVISVYDFKSSSMSLDEGEKAELITFVDGEQVKELKRRYPDKEG